MQRNVLQSLSQTMQDEVEDSDEDRDVLEVEDDVLHSAMQVFPKEELSNDLIDYALKDLKSQYEASKNYLFHHVTGSTEFLVRCVTWEVPEANTPETMYNAYVPKFDRTRTVLIENRKYAHLEYVNVIIYLSLIILCCMKIAWCVAVVIFVGMEDLAVIFIVFYKGLQELLIATSNNLKCMKHFMEEMGKCHL
jgi:hypothetical protein